MTKYAIIEAGVVVNIIIADASFAESVGAVRTETAGIGWSYANGVFTAPAAPAPSVPQTVSRAQFILALLDLDLLDEVETAIAAADRATQINYKERLEFERTYPLVMTMAAALGKTAAEVDALFMLAATK